ncbi:hypothetical protein [Kordiimonas marina]|uniref:hypothetical protein n=1 Tax=Kordiimonas marina TaxID=2872312 RepID=UPI001FF5F0B0|nr:hypothetical protein [Kordiimonas marina]MCJ9428281.1 hypothetical protein [Kordiimonas marina]
MSEKVFIEKRKRGRAGAIVTTRQIIVLLVLAITVYGGFRFWVGNPYAALCGDDCGSMHSLTTWILGFAILFGIVLVLAAIVGILAALFRRSRSSAFTDRLDKAQKPPKEDGKKDGQA